MTYSELAELLRYPDEPEQQELYVQTFEFDPACTLEIGWHLFGENYERGEFLVRVRSELRRYDIPESTELPDHLTHLLPLLERMERLEAARFVGQFLLPALTKIASAVKSNPYRDILGHIQAKLRSDFPDAPQRPLELAVFRETARE